MKTQKKGSKGEDVKKIQQALLNSGFNPKNIHGLFGDTTMDALIAFQKSVNLPANGIADQKTLVALGLAEVPVKKDELSKFTVEKVSQMFPGTPVSNIKTNLPFVLDGLRFYSLTEKPMALMALATIRAETASFKPISERKSKWNSSPDGHPFDLYDNRKELGNTGKPDGELFKGRGFIQLTGRNNYKKYGEMIGLKDGLIKTPNLANDAEIASKLLAVFLKDHKTKIKKALSEKNYKKARKLVNGGTHGLESFTGCYEIGDKIIT